MKSEEFKTSLQHNIHLVDQNNNVSHCISWGTKLFNLPPENNNANDLGPPLSKWVVNA